MSELYAITIASVTSGYADLDVTVVHPDAGPVPDDLTFALRALFGPFIEYSLQNEPPVSGAPLGREMDLDDYLEESFISANAAGFVTSSEIIAEENHPPPLYGDEGYEVFWDSDVRATATLRITPTHPAWIAHLEAGMSWDTAGYGTYDAAPWGDRPTRRPGDRVEEISDDPMEGMHTRGADEERMKSYVAEHLERSEYVLTTFGPSQYTTKEALSGDDLTVEALRELLGEPVKVLGGWNGHQVGTLLEVSDDGWCLVYAETSGSYGTTGLGIDDIESIGRAWFMRRVDVADVDV